MFLRNPVRTLTLSNIRPLRAQLQCGKKITPISTMMPVFLVNLSWQHPSLTPMTHTATKSFPPILLLSLPLIHCLFSECNRAQAPLLHWLTWLCTKKTTLVLAAMCADSIRAVGVLSNLFESLSVSLACSLRPETVESFLPSV